MHAKFQPIWTVTLVRHMWGGWKWTFTGVNLNLFISPETAAMVVKESAGGVDDRLSVDNNSKNNNLDAGGSLGCSHDDLVRNGDAGGKSGGGGVNDRLSINNNGNKNSNNNLDVGGSHVRFGRRSCQQGRS